MTPFQLAMRFIFALFTFLGMLHPAPHTLADDMRTCHRTQKYCYIETDTDGTKSVYGSNHCEEDMPCFNCHTMGNGICGPVTIDLRHHTVIARNGVFAYTAITHSYDTNRPNEIDCAEGRRPIAPHDITILACGKVIH